MSPAQEGRRYYDVLVDGHVLAFAAGDGVSDAFGIRSRYRSYMARRRYYCGARTGTFSCCNSYYA